MKTIKNIALLLSIAFNSFHIAYPVQGIAFNSFHIAYPVQRLKAKQCF